MKPKLNGETDDILNTDFTVVMNTKRHFSGYGYRTRPNQNLILEQINDTLREDEDKFPDPPLEKEEKDKVNIDDLKVKEQVISEGKPESR